MKNIIILSSDVYGNNADANGLCAAALADKLIAEGNSVDVVCYKSTGEKKGNAVIHEISFHEDRKQKAMKKSVFSKIRGFFTLLKNLVVGPYHNKQIIEAYCSECEKIFSQKRVEMIIAIYFPFETALALQRLKKRHPEIKFIIHELDKARAKESSKLSDKMMRRVYQRVMKRVYSSCDKIVVMRSHEDYWRKTFGRFAGKMCVSDLPMLYKPTSLNGAVKKEDNNVVVLYSGLLDKSYRNPQAALDAFDSAVFDDLNPLLKFYSKGDCEDLLENSKRAQRFGYIAKERLDEEIEKADFLLNIGNLDSDSVPSKIIVYLSTGKPIIHFAHDEKDSCLYYLEKYPLSLVLYVSDPVEENAKKILNFINANIGKRLDFDSVAQIFAMNTPKFSCDLIFK